MIFSYRSFLRNHFKLSYLQHKYFARSSCLCSADKVSQPERKGKEKIDLADFPPPLIRNFCVIAHIDHGKSTFSDRLLEMAGLLSQEDKVTQYLDKLQVEKERGITVKAQTASLVFEDGDKNYLLNLIDTPGHVDFSFEVYRSLPACQGAVLLVDATQGVQAQTIAHFNQALLSDKNIIPVINKIDLEKADVPSTRQQLRNLFSFRDDEILEISAKTGYGCNEVVHSIIERLSPPESSENKPMKALFFDSWFDQTEGVTALISMLDGTLKVGDTIKPLNGSGSYIVRSLGIFYPEKFETRALYPGQVGFLTANIRNLGEVKVGDIFTHELVLQELEKKPEELKTFHEGIPSLPKPKPMVFAGIFPCDPSQAKELQKALEKLSLNDASVQIERDSSPALGLGFRLGFLGLLHMDVFSQRLEQEYDAPTVVTTPSVPYRITIKGQKNIKSFGTSVLMVKSPHQLPNISIIEKYEEPIVIASVIAPNEFFGPLNSLFVNRRGQQLDTSAVDQTRLLFRFRIPLNEVVTDLFDVLKTMTSGYASFDYEPDGYKETHILKVDFLLNKKPIEELSSLVPRSKSREFAKRMCVRIKESLPPQQFSIVIQGSIHGKIVAREEIEALRKDVTADLYGGDITRAQKLLNLQKAGKERMRMIGKIPITRDSLIKILRTS